MNAPEHAQHLSASAIGEYAWFNEQPASRLDLEQWAINHSSAASQRESRLGHIAAAPNLVLWDVSGRKDVALDDLQTERIVQISNGVTIEVMAKSHSVSERTESKRLAELYLVFGTTRPAAAVITAICLDILQLPKPAHPPKIEDLHLAVCCLVGLGLTNKEIASQLNISVHTTGTHILSDTIYPQTGARNRNHLGRRLFELGVYRTRKDVTE